MLSLIIGWIWNLESYELTDYHKIRFILYDRQLIFEIFFIVYNSFSKKTKSIARWPHRTTIRCMLSTSKHHSTNIPISKHFLKVMLASHKRQDIVSHSIQSTIKTPHGKIHNHLLTHSTSPAKMLISECQQLKSKCFSSNYILKHARINLTI